MKFFLVYNFCMPNQIINVTKTFMPPIEEYQIYLNQIFLSDKITNQGAMLLELQEKLKNIFEVEYVHYLQNGTVPLQFALETISEDKSKTEVITTPFSYVATISSILWQKYKPVFVDIDENTFNIDVNKVEEKINKRTRAIMPVHVFGNACDVDKLDEIASKHSVPVIYDAAHAFGVEYKGKSLISFGDISTCSFHATKLFHTVEGGSFSTNNSEFSEKVELMKRFGHHGDEHFMLGINGKNSEFHAAMGLCNLKYYEDEIQKRKVISNIYLRELSSQYKTISINPSVTKYNYSYFPIVFESQDILIKKVEKLNIEGVFPRRYFYPSLNNLTYLEEIIELKNSERIADTIICLPLYGTLQNENVEKIISILKG